MTKMHTEYNFNYYNTLFYFQCSDYQRFKFFKLCSPFHSENLNTVVNSNPNHCFNLPPEIIKQILEYLNEKDIICLGIAKVFLPQILFWYRQKLNAYMLHTLCESFMEKLCLFKNCSLIPFVINQTFFFAIDFKNLSILKQSIQNFSPNIRLFWNTLTLFSTLFQPISKTQTNCIEHLKYFTFCSKYCKCAHYIFVNITPQSLRRLCCIDQQDSLFDSLYF